MSRMISPSQEKKQALDEMIEKGFGGEEDVFGEFIKLTVESVLQQALEDEQSEFLDRGRYQRGRKDSMKILNLIGAAGSSAAQLAMHLGRAMKLSAVQRDQASPARPNDFNPPGFCCSTASAASSAP